MCVCLVAQSFLIPCEPMDCSLPGSSVHGILQARILKWVSMPSLGDLPHPGIEPRSPALQVDSLPSEPPGKPICIHTHIHVFNQELPDVESGFRKTEETEIKLPTFTGSKRKQGTPEKYLLPLYWVHQSLWLY